LASLLWPSFWPLPDGVAGDFTATSAMIENLSLETTMKGGKRLEGSKRECS
jgi:hypothetical protein